MIEYTPSTTIVAVTAALLAFEFAMAALIEALPPRKAWPPVAWLVTIVAAATGIAAAADEPAGVRMVALILPLFYGIKVVVLATSRQAGRQRLDWSKWLGFTVFWPGMDPRRFQQSHPDGRAGAGRLLRLAVVWSTAGAACFLLARLLFAQAPIVATVTCLVALSLLVHFGLFDLVAAFWRWQGVNAGRLFRAPLVSTSLQEFWGRRWNVPFVEMMRVAVYNPLQNRIGRGPASLVAFLFSGFVHELAISVPAGKGYGLPMAYFVLHGILLTVERRLPNRTPGRAWTLFWVIAPAPLLFHPWFIKAVVWPLLG